MLFNSLTFLIFGALFFAAWPLARRNLRFSWGFVTVASFIFYGWWDWRFIFLIVASGLLDYFVALGIEAKPERRRLFLVLSILGNVGSLAVFKYLTFITVNLNQALDPLGMQLPVMQVALPVGISFYTFQSMSYTIEVYREQIKPTRNVLHFFAYLAMFPQLVAGPIVRAAHLLPQLTERREVDEAQRWEGLQLIAYGYFKKVVLADNLALAVNLAFAAAPGEQSALYWWLAVSMFAFQIYFDFSGYSDIARGLGRWMGYDFPVNFNHPYSATSLRDFWTRWHISLSTWFRDYLYIPLGGGRGGLWSGIRNLWITMLVAGLWHGASWNFVIWGGLFAFYISIERLTRWPERIGALPLGRHVCWLLVLLQVWIAWVFFRAETLEQALGILASMFNPSLFVLPDLAAPFQPALVVLVLAGLGELFFYFRLNTIAAEDSLLLRFAKPLFLALLLVACIYLRGPGSAFIYFQF